MKVVLDKIASSTRNAKINHEVELSSDIICREGYVIAARVLKENGSYNALELVSGRMSKVCSGDIVAGVLGARNALRGFCGVVPTHLRVGDKIHVLNLGGVFGICTSDNPELGNPTEIEVLGSIQTFPSFEHRVGKPASIHEGKVQPLTTLKECAPLIIVTGTCMSSGKTRAACEVIKRLHHAGKKVAAAKLSGISLMRDTLEMTDCGAYAVLNFTDAGIVCSTPENVLGAAKGILTSLTSMNPDCIVLEFGDGIMGEYGVMKLLTDTEIMKFVSAHVHCANDPVGVWGSCQYLSGKCPGIDVVSGPATDNEVGKKFIREKLQLKAANSMRDGDLLGSAVLQKVFAS